MCIFVVKFTANVRPGYIRLYINDSLNVIQMLYESI